jgi:uncharacterized protein (TIGR03437 family)
MSVRDAKTRRRSLCLLPALALFACAVSRAQSSPEKIQGTVQIVVQEASRTQPARYIYLLRTGSEYLELAFPDGEMSSRLPNQSLVEIRGRRSGSQFVMAESGGGLHGGDPFRVLSSGPRTTTQLGERKVAVILVTYNDNTSQPVDIPTMTTVMGQVNQFYKEQSFGQLSISSDFYGYLNLPVSAPCPGGVDSGSAFAAVTAAGTAAAQEAGIDLGRYQSYVFVGPPADGPCYSMGFASIGGSPGLVIISVLIQEELTSAISHELGHNLGLYHSHSIGCPGPYPPTTTYNPIIGCSELEYGDVFDDMGQGSAYFQPPHFNADKKELLGWLAAQSVISSGVYSIGPLEATGPNPLALKLTVGNDLYYMEYRQPIGFDAVLAHPGAIIDIHGQALKGVLFHLGTNSTDLLNMHPADIIDTEGPITAALDVNETYVDYANRFSATVLSVGPWSAQMLILIPTTTSPAVDFASPADGGTVAGLFNISIGALDATGLSKIELYRDGSLLTTLTAAPYTYAWDTAKETLGRHALKAVAYNTQGNTASQEITVTAVVRQVNAVVNAASYVPDVAPGSIVTLFIDGAPLPTLQVLSVPLPIVVGGVSVTVGNEALPLFYVSTTQINAQLPYDLPMGANNVVVSEGGASSPPFSFNVVLSAPGIFIFGNNRAVVQNQDYSVNDVGNPAKAGSTVIAYLTGQGALDNPIGLGHATPLPTAQQPLSRALATTTATIDGQPAQVSFAGMTPGFVGLLQINLQIPSKVLPGINTLQFQMGTFFSDAAVINLTN